MYKKHSLSHDMRRFSSCYHKRTSTTYQCYSSHTTHVTFCGTNVRATIFCTDPFSMLLLKMATSLLYCKPTAMRSPALLIEKSRGKLPPAGESCWKSNLPAPVREKAASESETLLVGVAGNVMSPRLETSRWLFYGKHVNAFQWGKRVGIEQLTAT